MRTTRRAALAALASTVALAAGAVALPASAGAVPAPRQAKAITLTASPAGSVWSQAVKLTASITPRGGGAPQGGTVTFVVGDSELGTAVATTRNTTLTTTSLPPGQHSLTVTYSGDARTAPGSSETVPVTVAPAPTALALAPTQARVLPGRLAEVKATVRAVAPASPGRRPTGTVSFTSSCRKGTVAVNANGVATWRAPLCPGAPGNRTIRATYTGSDRHAPSAQASTTVRMVFPTQDQGTTGDLGPDVPVESHGPTVSRYAQTFQAGRTGLLSDVSFGMWWEATGGAAPGPLRVTVQPVDGAGRPTGTVLGGGTVTTSAIAEGSTWFHTLALAQAPAITSGTRYALVFETDAQPEGAYGRWHLWTTQGDVYAQPLHRDEGAGWSPQTHDVAFTTFVHTPV